MTIPTLLPDFKNPLKDILFNINEAIRWPQREFKFHLPEFNNPVKTIYENTEKAMPPPVWPGHKDFLYPAKKQIELDLTPAVEDIAKKVVGVCEISFPSKLDDFVDLRKVADLPSYEFLPKLEPEGFQKALLNFFNSPQNASSSDQLSRYLNCIKNNLKLPQDVQTDLQQINKKLSFYSAVSCPSKEEQEREFAYYHFDPKSFSEKVLQSVSGELGGCSSWHKEMIIARKARELAPIHPALPRYLPPEMLSNKKAALVFTRMIEGVHEKIAILEQENLLHLLKCGQELKTMLEEGATRSGQWVKDVLYELSDPIEGLADNLQKKLGMPEHTILFGVVTAPAAAEAHQLDEMSVWQKLGKAIFGRVFRMRGPFSFVAETIVWADNYHRNQIDWKEVQEKGVKLRHIKTFDQPMSNLVSYKLSIDSDSEFSGKDFNCESALLKVAGKPLTKGKMLFVNGVANTSRDAENSATLISKYSGGAEVTGIYNGSQGLWADLKECFFHYKFISTVPVQQLVEEITKYFEEHDEEHQILITCHSQGAIITRDALMQLPPHIRNRISVLAVAPAAYIDRYLCGDVLHLISKSDWLVPDIDRAGRIRCKDTIIELDRKKWSLRDPWDHSFASETYYQPIRQYCEIFCEQNE